ncbi:MAG: hypothetical protein RL323_1265 [Pseudomonadota bacterium]|jgi:hypothetical protein
MICVQAIFAVHKRMKYPMLPKYGTCVATDSAEVWSIASIDAWRYLLGENHAGATYGARS